MAQEIIERVIPESGQSVRIGITGVPGVGKSTFIEAFGQFLSSTGKKVAVLAIDPSSNKSGGSILGDKTRMEELSQNDKVFIRPSPSKGSLGGVARATRESIILCEAAGFDIILIETVGVGQSEIAVQGMVDFFLLLMLAGAGDELQGIKRGIMEMADALIITKADGDNKSNAKRAKVEYRNALHLFPPNENGWIPRVGTSSSLENEGIENVWEIIQSFLITTQSNGHFDLNRSAQNEYWIFETINTQLKERFYSNSDVQKQLNEIKKLVQNNKISPFKGAETLLNLFTK